MEEAKNFLESDLKKLFTDGEITASRYSQSIKFEDPITRYNDLAGYQMNIRLLHTLFQIDFELHTIAVTGHDEVTARWTMKMDFWPLPWKPELTVTGRTVYQVDPTNGFILRHTDLWDALQRNSFLSLEGLTFVLKQFLSLQLTPALATPEYKVLKKLKEYEIRRYQPYIVAETPMAPGSGPASGAGFTDLAGYIFGGNQGAVAMDMTTPVFTAVAPGGSHSTAMQFVMDASYQDVSSLPAPKDSKIGVKQEQGRLIAAVKFSGWPLDFEVVQAESELRDALLRDQLAPLAGYKVARYNEPFVPPQFRRNEILIPVTAFAWPPAGEEGKH
ncbi:MAG: hypothetical protein WDW38_011487 [Sanguina aurantia]